MTVYAYNNGRRRETLRKHVKTGFYVIKVFYLDRGYHMQASRRLGVDSDDVKNCILKSYLLHDLGKAYGEMQDRIIKGRSAPGHEIISAIGALKVLEGWEKGVIALSILLHHHAIRSIIKAIRELEERDILRKPQKIHPDYWDEMGDIHRELHVKRPPETICYNDLTPLFNEVSRVYRNFKSSLSNAILDTNIALAYVILHPLITADVISATLATKNIEVKTKDELVKAILVIKDELMFHVKEFTLSRLNNQPVRK